MDDTTVAKFVAATSRPAISAPAPAAPALAGPQILVPDGGWDGDGRETWSYVAVAAVGPAPVGQD